MKKIIYNGEYFNVKDTLECGQLFRFRPFKDGFLVFSRDKCCYAYNIADKAIIECADGDAEYFYSYFDLDKDYSRYVGAAVDEGVDVLSTAAQLGKGIRILNQDKQETLFCFITSQNNHIPRIKAILDRLAEALGDKYEFMGVKYSGFPHTKTLSEQSKLFFTEMGLGYRDGYFVDVAHALELGFSLDALDNLPTAELKKQLLTLKGVGPKVADCITLFGYHRFDSFPVDTWMEKLYRENFGGTQTDRKKITDYFLGRFGCNSGIFQQYLFYYKRSLEK